MTGSQFSYVGINRIMTYIADKSNIQPRLYDLWKKNLDAKTTLKCKVGKEIQKFFEQEIMTNILTIRDDEIHNLIIELRKSYPQKSVGWFLRAVTEELDHENVNVVFTEGYSSTGDDWYLSVEFNATLRSNVNL